MITIGIAVFTFRFSPLRRSDRVGPTFAISAAHVEAVCRLLPTRYRLPVLVLDATEMRVGEPEALTGGDVDEPRGRWRVSAGQPRWVTPPPVLFEAVTALLARDDRTPGRHVFEGFGSDRFRTALTRAATAARGARVLAARPTPSPGFALAPRRDAVGLHRRTRRARRSRHNGGVAAHEGKHIEQYREQTRRSEIACGHFAA
jgi:integrase